MTRFPDFYLLGAAKCGTTSLWDYLRPHPELFTAAVKEPNYFAALDGGPNVVGPAPADELRARLHGETVTTEADYLALYADAGPDQRYGDASVRHLYLPEVAGRLAEARPDARLIVLLRDPVARLRSHYGMNRGAGLEPLPLVDALDAEQERIEAGWGFDWHYTAVGRYAPQLARYLDVFDREQLLVIGQPELDADPRGTVQRVCRHLGVNDAFEPDTTFRAKQAYVPRSRLVDAVRRPGGPVRRVLELAPTSMTRRAGAWLRQVNHQPTEPLPADRLADLEHRATEDRAEVARLLGRPVTW